MAFIGLRPRQRLAHHICCHYATELKTKSLPKKKAPFASLNHFGLISQLIAMFSYCHQIPKLHQTFSIVRNSRALFYPNMLTTTQLDVRYELLHRLYSISGQSRNADGGLFGLSLAQPRLDPHTDKPFVPPASASKDGKMADDTSFLWQMPGTDAMLVFGDKWVELHGYISQLHDQSHGKDPASGLLSKQTTAKQPVWIEHMIQLSRLRGYLTLYPSKATASSIITVHDDLVDVPEEFLDREQQPRPPKPTELAKEDQRQSLSNVAMIKTLPKNGELVHLLHMPVVSWDGEVTSREDVRVQARSHLQKFRSDVGGCAAHEGPVAKDRLARDLFCKVK